MLFRRRREDSTQASTPQGAASIPEPQEQSCPSLAKALRWVLERQKPEILDLGPLCGESVVYLASRGGRVTVESFEPPAPIPKVAKGEEAPIPDPLRIDQDDARFDMVLAWEQMDFVPPDRLEEFGAEMARILAKDGWLLLFSRASGGTDTDRFPQYRIVGDDSLVRQERTGESWPRWNHPTRSVERALGGFSIKGIHLQRNQLREFLAVRK